MRYLLLAAACLCAGLARAASPLGNWTQISSPPGGDAACFVFDANTPGVALAGSSGGLIYRSTDGGASWTKITVGGANEEFRIIGQSTTQTGVFYAVSTGNSPSGASGLIYASRDDGVTWAALANQPPATQGFARGLGRGIAIAPGGQTIVLSDHYGGIYRTTDGGQTWTTPLPYPQSRPYGLAQDPQTPGTLLAAGYSLDASGAQHASIFRSADFGATWTTVTPAALNVGAYPTTLAIAIQPGTNTVFATYEATSATTGNALAGVARSTDGGLTWAPVNTGLLPQFLAGSAAGGIVFDPATPSTIYLTTNGNASTPDGGGLYRSVDSGNHWVPIGKSLPQNGGFVAAARPAAPGYPAAVFVGKPDIAVSTNGGTGWVASNKGFANNAILSMAGAGTPGGLYAGTAGGLYRSADNGATWAPTAPLPVSHDVALMAVNLSDAGKPVYVAGLDRLARSTNAGASWSVLAPPIGAGLFVSGLLTDRTGRVYVTDNAQTLYTSTNQGLNWAAVRVGGTGDSFQISQPVVQTNAPAGSAEAGRMYAALTSGLWTSTDNGANWFLFVIQANSPVGGRAQIYAMAVLHVAPYTLFLDTSAGAQSFTPGQSVFKMLPSDAATSGFENLLVTSPGSAPAFVNNAVFNAFSTSDILESFDDFLLIQNQGSALASVDSQSGNSIFTIGTTLFNADADGSTFALPY